MNHMCVDLEMMRMGLRLALVSASKNPSPSPSRKGCDGVFWRWCNRRLTLMGTVGHRASIARINTTTETDPGCGAANALDALVHHSDVGRHLADLGSGCGEYSYQFVPASNGRFHVLPARGAMLATMDDRFPLLEYIPPSPSRYMVGAEVRAGDLLCPIPGAATCLELRFLRSGIVAQPYATGGQYTD